MTPDAHTLQELFLDVGQGYQLYVHDWGNKTAQTPIMYLHGGPGGGVNDRNKQLFSPDKQRVVFFDQRGAGRSLPYGSLEHNTTDELVNDINKIADKLELESFIITGGSWGSCLALTYAIRHPKRVKAMVLRGIFTARQSEIDFLDKGGFKTFYPDVWEQFVSSVPQSHQADPSSYLQAQIKAGKTTAVKQAAYAYGNMEAALLHLDDRFTPDNYDDFDPSSSVIEMHYLANNCFLPPNYIFDHVDKLTMPIWLVQGRYDMICPPITAYELHKVLPNSHLSWVTAGHVIGERAIHDVCRALLEQLAS